MFEYISGPVQFGPDDQIIVDIAGIGFRIHAATHTKNALKPGQVAKIYLSLYVREDQLKLYGFLNEAERQMFLKLQSISGIGPALALHILDAAALSKIQQAIINGDVAFFRTIKGIGPKIANRIVIELKGSLKATDIAVGSEPDYTRLSAIHGLMALGYPELEAAEIVQKVLNQADRPENLEDIIRMSLQLVQNKSAMRE